MIRLPGSSQILAVTLFVFGFVFCISAVAIAQDAEGKTPDDYKNRFTEMAGRISIAPAGRPKDLFQLRPQPALSWSNPTRQTAAGAMFLWTSSGRPQVALCAYPNGEQVIDLEFQSLSDLPLTADSEGQLLWQPVESGLQWQSIDDAPQPARSAFLRLRQMRMLARTFSAKLVPPNKNPIELRLLDTPVYRYELDVKASGKSTDSNPELIDGAVFTFVQGTDPEVLLLLESQRKVDQQVWRYALARMSIVPTQVQQGDSLVWETQWAIKRSDTPYFVFKSF